MQTLLRCPYSPRVQSHASTSVSLYVKNPKHWQLHDTTFGHKEILHTLIGMGSAALAAAVPYPGDPNFLERDNEVIEFCF